MRDQLKAFYLDWVNNYITVSTMAEHYGISVRNCESLISIGGCIYEGDHGDYCQHLESDQC